MTMVHVERVTCDDPECVEYVDELVREEPGKLELPEYVRSQLSAQGRTTKNGLDSCPSHPAATTAFPPL